MAYQEAKEQFGKMLRWTKDPKDQTQADKTVFIGEQVTGFYINKRSDVGQNDSNVYELEVAPGLVDGNIVSFWGSDLLDGKFDRIPLNCEVRVTYLGVSQPKTPKGRPYANFKVEYDESSKRPMREAGTGVATGGAVQAPAAAAPQTPTQAPAQNAAPSDQGF